MRTQKNGRGLEGALKKRGEGSKAHSKENGGSKAHSKKVRARRRTRKELGLGNALP